MRKMQWAGLLLFCCLLAGGCADLSQQSEDVKLAPPTPIQPVKIIGHNGEGPGEFKEPRDIDVDKNGRIYVADFRNYRVQILDADGKPLKAWGTKGSRPGEFNDLCGVSVMADGTIIVNDTWNHRTQVFDPEGNFIREWGGEVAPRGSIGTADGGLYIADSGNFRILWFQSVNQPTFTRAWGEMGTNPSQFIEPVGVALDKQNRLWVADNDNRRVQVFDSTGRFQFEFPIEGLSKEGAREPYIAILADNTVLVTVPKANRINRYNDSGKFMASYGGQGGEPGKFQMPTGVAVDQNGYVYISDTWNHRIQKFKLP